MPFDQRHRREFIALCGSAAVAWPVTARAQQADRVRRIAWLGLGRANESSPYVVSLRAGLRDLGWIEGRNLTTDLFWATGPEEGEAVARELLASDFDVIVTHDFMFHVIRSLKSPQKKRVVLGFSGDPLYEEDLQVTGGTSALATDLVVKRVELLKEWLPQTRRVAILARPQRPGEHLERQASMEVMRTLGIELSYFRSLPARNLDELETAFGAIIQDRCDALVVYPHSAMYEVSDRIARFALEAKLPSVSGWTPSADKGFLMIYGPKVRELYRVVARWADRILRGTAPADLAIVVPPSFYLAINLKTAAALGLDVPPMLLARADEMIE